MLTQRKVAIKEIDISHFQNDKHLKDSIISEIKIL